MFDMIKKYNDYSLGLGIPGLLLQVIGSIAGRPTLTLLGTLLLLTGLAFYAKSKGRSWVLCLWGFFSIIGVIILACLKDLTLDAASADEQIERPEVSFVIRTILIINCLLFWFPFFGVILGVAGLVGTFRTHGKWRILARIFIVLSIVATVGLLIFSASDL